MPKETKRPQSYQYEADGEMAVQQQIMESYQSGVIDQGKEQETYEQKRDQNQPQ